MDGPRPTNNATCVACECICTRCAHDDNTCCMTDHPRMICPTDGEQTCRDFEPIKEEH